MNLKNITRKYLSIVLITTMLCSCSTWDKLDKTERGAVIGTGAGAVIGGSSGSTGGALIGGAAGGLAGGVIGRELED